MKDDVSKLFPYAMGLLEEFEAQAVIVVSCGSERGMNGCAPALLLDTSGTAEAAQKNAVMIRALSRILRVVADRLESDMRSAGIRIEAPS